MKKNIFYVYILALILVACSSNNVNDNSGNELNNPNNSSGGNGSLIVGSWLVPLSSIKDGGPGKDGIPSIDNPVFISPNQASFLSDEDLIIGIIKNNEAKAYPHRILDWHEVINDNGITLSYCPLTGSALGWLSKTNGEQTTFGVSGLLYNSNLILYDRNTNSNWSQLRIDCINGSEIGNEPETTKIVETNWKTWKLLYPNTTVLSTSTGFDRDYNLYPYGDYKTNQNKFLFSVSPSNNALPNKQRVFAITNEKKSKVFQFSDFENGKTFRDTFNNNEYLIIGNKNIVNAFVLSEDYADLTFEYYFNDSEAFFKDDEGNLWSVFGEVISGSRQGESLTPAKSFVSFWFAVAAFYPNPEIFDSL